MTDDQRTFIEPGNGGNGDDASEPTILTPIGDARGQDEDAAATQISNFDPRADDAVDAEQETKFSGTPEGGDESIVPGFRVISKLGEGGMGVVYKAVQTSLNRMVALKVVKRSLSVQADFVKRFRREALAAARLNHPNIVSIYDYGVANGTAYMALEFVEGINCQAAAKKGPIDVDLAFRVIRDSILGLSHAQHHGLIHRDIKPANILLVAKSAHDARGGNVVAKVVDLGLAKNDKSDNPELQRVTQIGLILGTPEHMSPEQACGEEVDFRCDLYALGSSLYYLVTGQLPFQGNTAIEVMDRKINHQAPNPQDFVPDVDDDLIRVLDRMMAKKPASRYESYEEALKDIEALLDGTRPLTPAVPRAESSIATRRRAKPLSSGKKKKKRRARPSRPLLVAGVIALLAAVVVIPLILKGGDDSGSKVFVPPTAEAIQQSIGELRELYHAGRYDDLGRSLQRATQPWLEAGRPVPPEFEGFRNTVTQAMTGDLGRKEREIIGRLLTVTDPREVQTLLLDFEKDYPFSPDLEIVKNRLRAAELEIAQEALRRQTLVDADDYLKQLEGAADADLLADFKKHESHLSGLLAGFDEGERTQRKTTLVNLAAERLKRSEGAAVAELDGIWKAGRYQELNDATARQRARHDMLAVPLPATLVRFETLAKSALDGDAGARERQALADAQVAGRAADPLRVIELLADFEKRFPFSPAFDEAAGLRTTAQAEAPEIEIETNPSNAIISIDGKAVGNSKWNGRVKRGRITVEARRDGCYPTIMTVDHEGSKSHLFRLSPLPDKLLQRKNVRTNVSLSLKPLMEWRSVGTWAQPDDPAGKRAIIEGEADGSDWISSDVDINDIGVTKRIFNDADGFVLTWFFGFKNGQCEVRVLPGAEGDWVVAGIDERGFYLGTRNTRTNTYSPWASRPATAKDELFVGVEWHGDVLRFVENIESQNPSFIGAVRPPWTVTSMTRFELAVRSGVGRFGDLLAFPMHAD